MGGFHARISILQVFMVLTLSMGLTSHVIVNPMLLDASGRDAWIAVLMAGAVYLLWAILIFFLMKASGQHNLIAWLTERVGPVLTWLTIAPICVQIYLIGGMTVFHTATWTVTNYLPVTPGFILAIALVFVSYYSAKTGIKTIAIGAGVVLPFVVLLGIFVASANLQHKDYGMLQPFLEYGWKPVYKGMMYAGGGYAELIFLLLLQHRVKSRIRLWQIILYNIVLIYLTLGPITGAIAEFGPEEAAKQWESPYEQWRLVEIGHYVQHMDFFSVYQWLSGAYIRISLAMFLLGELFSHSVRRYNWIVLAIAISYIILFFVPISQHVFYEWMYHIYFPYSLVTVVFISLLWGGIALFTKQAKRGTA